MTDTLIIRVSAAWKARGGRLDWNPGRAADGRTKGSGRRGETRKTSDDYDEPLLIIWKLTSRRHRRRSRRGRQLWARKRTRTVIHGSDGHSMPARVDRWRGTVGGLLSSPPTPPFVIRRNCDVIILRPRPKSPQYFSIDAK